MGRRVWIDLPVRPGGKTEVQRRVTKAVEDWTRRKGQGAVMSADEFRELVRIAKQQVKEARHE